MAQAYNRWVLRPGGELHLADWGRAQNGLMRVSFLGVRFLDGFATTGENGRGCLVPLMRAAGFADVRETDRRSTVFGTRSMYRAVNPRMHVP